MNLFEALRSGWWSCGQGRTAFHQLRKFSRGLNNVDFLHSLWWKQCITPLHTQACLRIRGIHPSDCNGMRLINAPPHNSTPGTFSPERQESMESSHSVSSSQDIARGHSTNCGQLTFCANGESWSGRDRSDAEQVGKNTLVAILLGIFLHFVRVSTSAVKKLQIWELGVIATSSTT